MLLGFGAILRTNPETGGGGGGGGATSVSRIMRETWSLCKSTLHFFPHQEGSGYMLHSTRSFNASYIEPEKESTSLYMYKYVFWCVCVCVCVCVCARARALLRLL